MQSLSIVTTSKLLVDSELRAVLICTVFNELIGSDECEIKLQNIPKYKYIGSY